MIDLTGQRFGRLLVIERAGSNKNGEATWDCLCDCGKAKVVLGTLLRRGATRSCGCYLSDAKIKNLVGRRFGKLIVIEIAGRTAAKKVLWKCRCDCGNEKVIIGAGLLRGRSTDCGCVPKPHHKKLYMEATRNQTFSGYKSSAKKRGICFELSESDFHKIVQQKCYYCGSEKKNIKKSTSENGDYIYSGIDRVDSRRGYTLDNVVPCCWICNDAKKAKSQEEFLSWVERVYNHSIKEKK